MFSADTNKRGRGSVCVSLALQQQQQPLLGAQFEDSSKKLKVCQVSPHLSELQNFGEMDVDPNENINFYPLQLIDSAETVVPASSEESVAIDPATIENPKEAEYVAVEGTSYSVSINSKVPTIIRIKKKVIEDDEFSLSSEMYDSDVDPHFSDVMESESESTDSDLQDKNIRTKRKIPLSSIKSIEATTADGEDPAAEIKKGKKRKCDPDKWISKKMKLLRNSGQEYTSAKSKKLKRAKAIRPPCGEKCRLKCPEKISEELRGSIFSAFWALAELQRQREYIVSHCEQIKPKYRYTCTQNLRQLNTAFYFDINSNRLRVCKQFFMATLDINERTIKTALAKKTEAGFVAEDRRGKHGNHPSVDPEIKESVRKFINKIPRVESHYLRAQSNREYIEGGKSLADLYRDYKEDRTQQQLPFANAVMFNRIFNSDFNISFFQPKKDLCDLCESFKNADDAEKLKLAETYHQHKKETELSRKEKETDKQNEPTVAVYDLQAVMPVPRGLVSSFYYKSKLNCFNFTVSDLHAKNVICYFWNESEGKRGAIEIGSCVYKYLKTLKENSTNPDNMDVIFFSDNCCGQQKNKYLLSAYAYATRELKIKSITHKFLIRGHSQNEGDNVHSVIEKQIAKHLKAAPIYVPEQYVTLIQLAKKNGPPYQVQELTHEDFFDLKLLAEKWGSNYTVDTEKKQ